MDNVETVDVSLLHALEAQVYQIEVTVLYEPRKWLGPLVGR